MFIRVFSSLRRVNFDLPSIHGRTYIKLEWGPVRDAGFFILAFVKIRIIKYGLSFS